jgi:hypothetical protein
MFIAVITAAALYVKVGLKIRLIGLEVILLAALINLSSSLEQQPLSPLEAHALSWARHALSRESMAFEFHDPW